MLFAPVHDTHPERGGGCVSSDEFICARPGCDIESSRKTHNQKYCSDECCRLATNQRIMAKYYERKAQRSGKERYCVTCNMTKLSRYNNSDTCSACDSARQKEIHDSFVEMLGNTTFMV